MAQAQQELSLQLEQVRPLSIYIRTLCLQHTVQTLTLQGTPGHCEVHKGHTRAQIWWKLNLLQEEEKYIIMIS